LPKYLRAFLHDDALSEVVRKVYNVEPLSLDAVGDARTHEQLVGRADVAAALVLVQNGLSFETKEAASARVRRGRAAEIMKNGD
jgi:hypothetical protein